MKRPILGIKLKNINRVGYNPKTVIWQKHLALRKAPVTLCYQITILREENQATWAKKKKNIKKGTHDRPIRRPTRKVEKEREGYYSLDVTLG